MDRDTKESSPGQIGRRPIEMKVTGKDDIYLVNRALIVF